MQLDTTKTVFVVLVWGMYTTVSLASPAPLYAVVISLGLFTVFGVVVLGVGLKHGVYRATRS